MHRDHSTRRNTRNRFRQRTFDVDIQEGKERGKGAGVNAVDEVESKSSVRYIQLGGSKAPNQGRVNQEWCVRKGMQLRVVQRKKL